MRAASPRGSVRSRRAFETSLGGWRASCPPTPRDRLSEAGLGSGGFSGAAQPGSGTAARDPRSPGPRASFLPTPLQLAKELRAHAGPVPVGWGGRGVPGLTGPHLSAGGSFRHFLWQVCKELQSSSLSLLLLCPSSAVNKNKVRRPRPGPEARPRGRRPRTPPSRAGAGPRCPCRSPQRCLFLQGKYLLTPSPATYGEEQLLHFLGQLLGIAIRADVPLPLDLLPSFWKTLVGEPLDPDRDLQEADILTYNYVKKFESVSGKAIRSEGRQEQCPPDPHCCLHGLGDPSSPTKDWLGSVRERKPFLPAGFASWGRRPLASLPADSSRLGGDLTVSEAWPSLLFRGTSSEGGHWLILPPCHKTRWVL